MASLDEFEASEPEFKPLTAEEARKWREKNPSISPATVVVVQALVGVLVALAAWGLTGRANVGWSAGYGALAVVIPAALFARGLARWMSLKDPRARLVGAAFGFFVWEMVKMALTVAMLFAAPRLVVGLSWPALLLGLFLTIKVYWVAMAFSPKRVKRLLERTGE